MAIEAADKVVVDEVVAKLEELNQYILVSRPLQSTGASHLFNEVLGLTAKLKALEVTE
ncbi:hypothetical protein D3C86_1478730 [compost metagenome]